MIVFDVRRVACKESLYESYRRERRNLVHKVVRDALIDMWQLRSLHQDRLKPRQS